MRRIRERIEKFRDEWAAAGEAIEANEQRAERRAARQQRQQPQDDTSIHNTATIAGNVANSVVHHHGS